MLSERNENVVDLPLFFPTLSYSGRFRDDGKTLNALAIRRLTNILIDGYRPIDERVVRDQRHNNFRLTRVAITSHGHHTSNRISLPLPRSSLPNSCFSRAYRRGGMTFVLQISRFQERGDNERRIRREVINGASNRTTLEY